MFLAGAAVGFFLNPLIDGLSQGHSILTAPRCAACESPFPFVHLIPLIGYIVSRGRCASCGAPRPYRVLAVAIASVLLLSSLGWYFGFTLKAAILAIYGFIFIILFVVDIEHRLVPNQLIFPSILGAPFTAYLYGLNPISIFSGGLLALGIMLLSALVYRDSVGVGDIKLALFIGLITGFPEVFRALFFTAILAGLVSAFLLITKTKGRKDYIPYAPFMVAGAGLALILG